MLETFQKDPLKQGYRPRTGRLEFPCVAFRQHYELPSFRPYLHDGWASSSSVRRLHFVGVFDCYHYYLNDPKRPDYQEAYWKESWSSRQKLKNYRRMGWKE